MSERVFFDTNVFVYVFDTGEPEKQEVAQNLIKTEGLKGKIVLSTQVLQEFFVTVTRKLSPPLSVSAAYDAVRGLFVYSVVRVNKQLILSAIRRAESDKFSFWDALIVEAALKSNCKILYTEDMQDGRKINKLVIRNPFLIKKP